MVGEVLAGLSAISSLFGSLKSAQQNNAVDAQLHQRQSELDSWYNREYNQNYLDTDEARSVVQVLNNQRAEQMKKVDQGNAIKGASDETRVATADKLNRSLGDQTTRLAGMGTQRKYLTDRQYQNLKFGLDQTEQETLMRKSQNWTNFMNNAVNAGMGFAEAGANGAFDEWDNKLSNYWQNRKAAKAFNATGPSFNAFKGTY